MHTLEVVSPLGGIPLSATVEQKAPPALTVLGTNSCAAEGGLDLHFITEIQDKAAGDSL